MEINVSAVQGDLQVQAGSSPARQVLPQVNPGGLRKGQLVCFLISRKGALHVRAGRLACAVRAAACWCWYLCENKAGLVLALMQASSGVLGCNRASMGTARHWQRRR